MFSFNLHTTLYLLCFVYEKEFNLPSIYECTVYSQCCTLRAIISYLTPTLFGQSCVCSILARSSRLLCLLHYSNGHCLCCSTSAQVALPYQYIHGDSTWGRKNERRWFCGCRFCQSVGLTFSMHVAVLLGLRACVCAWQSPISLTWFSSRLLNQCQPPRIPPSRRDVASQLRC